MTSMHPHWYTIKFGVSYAGAPEEIPLWEIDLIIAHQVLSPVLQRYKDNIILWRFHRMVSPKEKLHQFSFHCFVRPDTLNAIYEDLEADRTIQALVEHNYVRGISREGGMKSNLEDTSDKEWSPHVKKAWPHYMMGVSKMWLALIDDIANLKIVTFGNIKDLLRWYKGVNGEISEIWTHGAHPFLHHLNAIFGYGLIDIQSVHKMRF